MYKARDWVRAPLERAQLAVRLGRQLLVRHRLQAGQHLAHVAARQALGVEWLAREQLEAHNTERKGVHCNVGEHSALAAGEGGHGLGRRVQQRKAEPNLLACAQSATLLVDTCSHRYVHGSCYAVRHCHGMHMFVSVLLLAGQRWARALRALCTYKRAGISIKANIECAPQRAEQPKSMSDHVCCDGSQIALPAGVVSTVIYLFCESKKPSYAFRR